MRWLLCGVLCLLVTAPTARAGLYLPGTTAPWPLPATPDGFLRLLNSVRDRPAALDNARKLEDKLKKEGLSVNDTIALGGYYILARDQADKAIEVLTEALRREPKNFMLLANLANAYQLRKEYRRAAGFQQQVLSNWPDRFKGWNPEQLWWYRRAEKYTLNLLELRERERLLNKPDNTIDDLFPRTGFNDYDAKYLVGEIALKTRDRLPPDVFPLVEQLLLWMPYDNRLYWLFGELLNARGDVRDAYQVLDKLVYVERFDNRTLLKHRRTLREATESDPRFKKKEEKAESPVVPEPANAANTSQASWLPDWRQLSVGFGTGLVVGILLLLQVRQLRRRFSGSPHAPSPG
jgi:hypothetical protein